MWEPLLGKLGNLYLEILGLCTWQLGILYLGTFWALQESVLGNLGGPSLGSLYSELLWEPAQSNFGNLGSPVEPLLGNLAGTATIGTLDTLYEPLLGNLYL